jgi:methyltransferase (TIGR00027 family)
MDSNRASRTAEHVALFRALESSRRRGRLFHDPFAVLFLSSRYRLLAQLAALPPVGRRIERYIDERWPGGPRGSAVVRTRLIDDLLVEALAGGAAQVLLLGAGYDSRAYRIPALAAATVFEVDHPATQAAKRRLIEGRLPADRRPHVRFVPVDLLRDDLGAELLRAGFVAGARTVVVWEGVTNYLTASTVDATLRLLAATTGAGSRIVFTYIDRGALADGGEPTGSGAPGASGEPAGGGAPGAGGPADGIGGWRDAVRDAGEPWTFGFEPAELPGYLAARGLALTTDLSTRDAAARYLAPLHRDEPAAAFYHVVAAEVS